MSAEAAEETKGPGIVLQPEEGQSYWQPIWANGYSIVKLSPKAKLQPQEVLVQAAACVLARVGATSAPPTAAKASARAIISFFMCKLPRLLAWDLSASLSFATKKPSRGCCSKFPLCT
jgi:hypothetical protein